VALVAIRERPGRPARKSDGGERTRQRTFQLQTDDPEDDGLDLFMDSATVELRDPHPLDSGLLCVSISADEDQGSDFLWQIVCEYSSDQEQEGKQAENPLDRPTDESWDAAEYEEAYEVDIAGNAVTSSSGEPFDPPLKRDAARSILRIQRNEATFDTALTTQYRNVTNEGVWRGFAGGTCLMKPIKAQSAYENGVAFFRVSYEIHINPDGWTQHPIDRAFSYLDDAGERQPFRDPQGTPLQAPTLLNGAGGKLTLAVTLLRVESLAAEPFILVDSHTGFPQGGGANDAPTTPYVVKVDDEKMLVTSYLSPGPAAPAPYMGVERGYDGTMEADHDAGATVEQLPTELEFVPYAALPFDVFGL
jgi:hypothetical protein